MEERLIGWSWSYASADSLGDCSRRDLMDTVLMFPTLVVATPERAMELIGESERGFLAPLIEGGDMTEEEVEASIPKVWTQHGEVDVPAEYECWTDEDTCWIIRPVFMEVME